MAKFIVLHWHGKPYVVNPEYIAQICPMNKSTRCDVTLGNQ